MPIRTFECFKCGNKFERILSRQEFDELHVKPCPECDTDALAIGHEVPARRNPQWGIQT